MHRLFFHARIVSLTEPIKMKNVLFSFLFALCILPSVVVGQPTEPPASDCECVALCEECGTSDTADCKTVCEYAADPATCVEKCDTVVGNTEATDPTSDTTEVTDTTSAVDGQPMEGSTSDCECVALCEECGTSNTADCKTVCEYAADPTTCVEKCDAVLHTGDTEATDPTSKGYAQKIGMVSIVAAIVGAVF
jgi:hypothetical protein